MQQVAPPTLQAPMPPSISSDSSAQIVRPGNNVQEYQKAYNASTGDQWFCLCRKKLSRSVRPSSSTFEQQCKTSQQHLCFMQENRPLQPRERTLLTFFPAKRSSGNPSPQSTPTMPTATSTPITEQSVVLIELPLPPPPCPKVLPFGIKDAIHLCRAYPLLHQGHEKASWRLVDGLGSESVDPPCTGEGSYESMGCIVPCSPCAGVRGSVVQRTVQSFFVTGHRLQDMEASSGIRQHMYMVLPGSQGQKSLFHVVRTICTDRNCTELELATRCDSACMIASVYAKYPELQGKSTASAMDNLRPGNVTGNTAAKAPQRLQILMNRKWAVVRVPVMPHTPTPPTHGLMV